MAMRSEQCSEAATVQTRHAHKERVFDNWPSSSMRNAVTVLRAAFGIIRCLAMAPRARQQGIAIQFASFIGFAGSTPAVTLSAAKKMNKFDQLLRLILKSSLANVGP